MLKILSKYSLSIKEVNPYIDLVKKRTCEVDISVDCTEFTGDIKVTGYIKAYLLQTTGDRKQDCPHRLMKFVLYME